MSPILLLLLVLGVVSANFKPEREFEVKQANLLNNGRGYLITEVGKLAAKDGADRYTVENDLLSVGKKLRLLERGQPLYELKHKLGHLYQKWNLYDARSQETIGTLKHRPSILHDSYKLTSAKLGNFRVTGNVIGRTFTVKKDGHKVAEIHKKRFHMRDTYSVEVAANQDVPAILLLTIGIDEIRQH